VSDRGGLWLSAVVPVGTDKLSRRALPLVAGLALCAFLTELGVSGFRLRWPNDVLIDHRKLAGLLVDEFSPGLAVIGVGLNVQNQPDLADPGLENQTARLADLLPTVPQLSELTASLLRHIRQVLDELGSDGAPALFLRVNQLWNLRYVELDLDGIARRGLFTGVDPEGRLALSTPDGKVSFYEAHQVRHLTET
jgi:BirA family biotin operon repressor/biotin-[acetyl-CoA-carboxylase] ligase